MNDEASRRSTQRSMRAGVPSFEEYLAQWSALHGRYEPPSRGLVRGYLRTMHVLARPFVVVRASPDAVTMIALLLSLTVVPLAASVDTPGERLGTVLAVAAVIAVSGLLDGLDGAVAVLSGRTTRWGMLLDSVADRISELAWLAVLALLGAPVPVVVAGAACSMMLEYVRARAAVAGMTGIGVVTVAERPVRIALASMACVGLAVSSSTGVGAGLDVMAATAWAWLVLSAVAVVHLLVVVRRTLDRA